MEILRKIEALEFIKSCFPRFFRIALKKILYGLRQRNFKPYLTSKNFDGVEFDFWIGDTAGREWYDRTDRLSAEEMRFVRRHMIGPGDVVLDCGAHHGCTAILFSRWVGDTGKVVAFEPMPTNCDILAKNVELNGITNISIVRKAVGAKRGRIRIDGVSDSTVIFSNQGMEVEVTCLDDYAHLKPTFIKIDVEGFEYQVLQGAERILSQRPRLAVEIHGDKLAKYGTSVEDILGAIGVNGYKLWIQWKDTEKPQEYDGRTAIARRVHLFCVPK